MFKAMCGVAAGACGGLINLYWAKGSDISDINAKFGAQHTVTGAIGLVFAAFFAKSVSKVTPFTLFLMYFLLTYLHLYGNIRCMQLISFDYLNTSRLDMILSSYITGDDDSPAEAPSPQAIAKRESLWLQIPVFERIFMRKKSPPIYFGVAYDEFCRRSGKRVEELRSELCNRIDDADFGYVISVGRRILSSSGTTENLKPCVVVSLFSDISSEQQTKAYTHARLLANILQERLEITRTSKNQKAINIKSQLNIESEAKHQLESMWNEFLEGCTGAGWDLTRSELQTKGYEIEIT